MPEVARAAGSAPACRAWSIATKAPTVHIHVRDPRTGKPIEEKESFRWLEGADQAATVCACARNLTVIADREGDIYAAFALRPERTELLVRAAHDRARDEGERLWTALSAQPVAGWAELDLPGRRGRTARLALRHASLTLARPRHG